VITHDFYPTLLQIAGLPLQPEQHLDGVSVIPLLKQNGELAPRPLFWHFPNYIGARHPNAARPMSVVRSGDFKLLESLEDNRVELYNLRDDLGEQHDLAGAMPEKANELRRLLDTWRTAAGVQMPRANPEFRGDSQ
jgi:arylsulfatase A-like enzyme